MFETVFDIVADEGDPNQTPVATLNALLSTSTAITQIPVLTVVEGIPAGTGITLISSNFQQAFTTSSVANAGDTVINVQSATPNFAYPIGTPVQLQWIPGWSSLLDANNCPASFLPYLAQFNGTIVPAGLDTATARAKISSESAQQRGTLASVTAAVTRNLLSGAGAPTILERVDSTGAANAYWFVVVIQPTDLGVPAQTLINASLYTGGGPIQGLVDSVNAVRPGGVMWSLVIITGWTITQMENSAATIGGVEGSFVTVGGLERNRPGT
jgi:hypothetical protein